MSRKNSAPVREVLADPIFNSVLVTKLINTIMLDGKKSIAQEILYKAFDIVKEKTQKDPMEVFLLAVENITPQLEVRTRRIGGTNYQVPTEVSARRKQTLSLRWLVQYARLRNEKTMDVRLANEIIDASNKTGGAIKKREDTHKMVEANRAFAHFRW
ncbi:SSU ribosomal protein S7p (S5e) [Mycoplasmopsis meleagridis]|uniref:Small ribosomal subunit protein uS7 n=1 Tax=Mycoplasmopsis meleagridis ATCC 25294 TaxID=1264554 RepID=A0A0F5H282_9BACT|nr:30S ribosomal protein S7 [Mycoplasmopsis meleagridis]KKB26947.1 SSU ribosomal protein S7p (S5e) [Mycoplasmopsis meleagridis ATCC 25294]OAD18536.1 SSU ribosomal protein S7p (S5e) [Mycoplasmopsis meleagridis]VEU77595.1 30S ribosomal protein S7 [Mycoplasmopsis meleagridis]